MSFTPFFSQALCRLDVLRLRAFVPTAQQNNDGVAPLLEINAVSRAMVDAQFADALSYGFRIPRKSKGETVQAGRDQATRPLILEPCSPLPECLGLL